jgi:hypothetical protein
MNTRTKYLDGVLFLVALFVQASCGSRLDQTVSGATNGKTRTVTVAQSGNADVIGTDNVALQKAANMLRPGDVLDIGPGTYRMENSLFIPSGVTVRGALGRTVLRKGEGVESPLTEDGDYGENQLMVADPKKFRSGMGVSILDDAQSSGWDVTVSTITAVEGNILRIGPMTLRDYDAEQKHARVHNAFPILCAMDTENVVFENIIVDGNKDQNPYLDGCRGGAVYLYKSRNATVRNCVARNYNGDGISFQITDNVQVVNCESYGHSGFGIHPGTGSPRAVVKGCRIHDNGQVGLFLCWRVRDGQFSDNVIENNGRYGISIGHKDTDNVFTNNTITGNRFSGIYFREETFKNSGHRNTFNGNKITNNGDEKHGYGFYVEPHAGDIVIANNQIAETRRDSTGTQRYGVYKVAGAGSIRLQNNTMEGHSAGDYHEARGGQ